MSTTAVNPAVASALQQATVDLNALALVGKQLHWNVQGAEFFAVHEFLDTIVDEARTAYDDFAERLVALGGSPDARPETIVATSSIKPLDAGHVSTTTAVEKMEEALNIVAEEMIRHIDDVDAVDHLSADLLITTSRDLQKSAWMLRAQLGRL